MCKVNVIIKIMSYFTSVTGTTTHVIIMNLFFFLLYVIINKAADTADAGGNCYWDLWDLGQVIGSNLN